MSEIRATRPTRGLFRGAPFGGGGAERESGRPIQPPAVSRRVNAQSTRPLCRLSGLMRSRTQKWRRCCGIVHRLFLPSSRALYEAPILFIDLTRAPSPLSLLSLRSSPNYAPLRLRFLLPIYLAMTCARARAGVADIPFRRALQRVNFNVCNGIRYKLERKSLSKARSRIAFISSPVLTFGGVIGCAINPLHYA